MSPFLGFRVILKHLPDYYMALKNPIFLEGHTWGQHTWGQHTLGKSVSSYSVPAQAANQGTYFGFSYPLAELAILRKKI